MPLICNTPPCAHIQHAHAHAVCTHLHAKTQPHPQNRPPSTTPLQWTLGLLNDTHAQPLIANLLLALLSQTTISPALPCDFPPKPQATKHHPSSVDLELVKRLLADTRATTMGAFLAREFDNVSKALAGTSVRGCCWLAWVVACCLGALCVCVCAGCVLVCAHLSAVQC